MFSLGSTESQRRQLFILCFRECKKLSFRVGEIGEYGTHFGGGSFSVPFLGLTEA
jgi:hypothetical protein